MVLCCLRCGLAMHVNVLQSGPYGAPQVDLVQNDFGKMYLRSLTIVFIIEHMV